MASINKVILVGNLGRDPEARKLPGGDSVCNIQLATSESWTDKGTGERKEKTEWHRVVIFGKLADIAEKYLRKGSKIYIEGQLQTRKWTDKAGQEKYSTEVVLRGFGGTMVMLDGKVAGQTQDDSPAKYDGGGAPTGGADFDDSIPF